MSKVDLKREERALYAPPAGRFVEVDVPTMRYLAVDGSGAPGTSPAYQQAVEALFTASYAVKFHSKREVDRAHLHDELLPGRGLRPTGLHHEIYLSDPRRVAPEKLRTILRQPVRPA
jgi:hypothetical protein